MVLCADPAWLTCEQVCSTYLLRLVFYLSDPDLLSFICQQDLLGLCAPGFHLCTHSEFNALNDDWEFTAANPALGEIYCRGNSKTKNYQIKFSDSN